MDNVPKLYNELASWWPLLSSPEEYDEEADFYRQELLKASNIEVQTILELGSGGGNNASHLKRYFQMTLVDLSPGMLQVSQKLNPECKHLQGDMRTVRLDQQFDAIFVHDALMYLTSYADLTQAVETAFVHCRLGGVALFAPDGVKETFMPSTHHGGHDVQDRGLRYLEWSWDPDPEDSTFTSYMVYVMRQDGEEVECVHEKHLCGLFSRSEWQEILNGAGFIPHSVPFEHSELEPESTEVFIGVKPFIDDVKSHEGHETRAG